ncbi:MAG: hypothetical protein VX589_03950 [Myxococcota bacterium]|nr:hypothetical protein [Myxococcota bacterium]
MKVSTYLALSVWTVAGCTADSITNGPTQSNRTDDYVLEDIGGRACPAIAVTCMPGFIQCTAASDTCRPVSMGQGNCRQTILCTKSETLPENQVFDTEENMMVEACEPVNLRCPDGQVRCLVATPACDTVTAGEGECRQTIFCRDAPEMTDMMGGDAAGISAGDARSHMASEGGTTGGHLGGAFSGGTTGGSAGGAAGGTIIGPMGGTIVVDEAGQSAGAATGGFVPGGHITQGGAIGGFDAGGHTTQGGAAGSPDNGGHSVLGGAAGSLDNGGQTAQGGAPPRTMVGGLDHPNATLNGDDGGSEGAGSDSTRQTANRDGAGGDGAGRPTEPNGGDADGDIAGQTALGGTIGTTDTDEQANPGGLGADSAVGGQPSLAGHLGGAPHAGKEMGGAAVR